MVYKSRPIPFLPSLSSVRWILYLKLLQPRTQDSFSLQLPGKGLFHWEKQGLGIFRLSPSFLFSKVHLVSAAKSWGLPSSTQQPLMGQWLYLGNGTVENIGGPIMLALAYTAGFPAKRGKLKRPGDAAFPIHQALSF